MEFLIFPDFKKYFFILCFDHKNNIFWSRKKSWGQLRCRKVRSFDFWCFQTDSGTPSWVSSPKTKKISFFCIKCRNSIQNWPQLGESFVYYDPNRDHKSSRNNSFFPPNFSKIYLLYLKTSFPGFPNHFESYIPGFSEYLILRELDRRYPFKRFGIS